MPPGHFLGALEMLQGTVEIYNIFIECPLLWRKCLGTLAISKVKHAW